MAEKYDERYRELLLRKVPREGIILPKKMADIVLSLDQGKQPISEYDRLFNRLTKQNEKA